MSRQDARDWLAGRARRCLDAAGRLRRLLDPRVWVIQVQYADLIAFTGFLIVSTAVFAALRAPEILDTTVGTLTISFMVLVLVRAYRAGVAQKNEERNEIADAHSLARQCRRSLRLISASLSKFPEDYRTYLALGRLSAEIRLFVTRYRRYIDKGAAGAVLEAENLILKAELSRSRGLGIHIRAIERQIGIIARGIVTVDDPGLRAARGRL